MKIRAVAVAFLALVLFAAPVVAAPSVTLVSPPPGTVSNTVTLDVAASTDTVRVDYELDGTWIAFDATCCSWDETWDSTAVSDGAHVVTAVATDAGGGTATSAPVAITVANLFAPDPVSSTPSPTGTYACVGAPADAPTTTYPWPTTFVEAQAWWMPTRLGQTGQNFGHVHVGGCIPEREHVSGATIPLDIRVLLHDNPGTVASLSIVAKGARYEKTVATLADPTLVGAPGTTVSRWFHVDLPLSVFDASGLQEIRYRVFVDQPGTSDIMHASLNFQTTIDNGAPLADVTRRPYLRFKGWYTGAGYCEAAYRSDLTPFPDSAVSGTWAPALSLVWHGELTDRPVTHHAVRLDPDFHAVPPVEGTVLREGDGGWEGIQPIDTTALPDGVHRLHLKADCDDPRATNSGVGVVAFDVANQSEATAP